MRVCVIGGGASGLSVARYLKTEPKVEELVVYENSGQIGGQWFYTDRTETDEYGAAILTNMYKNLRTNIPIPSMVLKDYDHENGVNFPGWETVMNYLKNFATKEDLLKFIKLHCRVNNVTKIGDKWKVTLKNYKENHQEMKEFDYVFVCTGHFNKPTLPKFKGENIFKGRIVHSHAYRRPEDFHDKRVLVIGFGPSGEDISHDLILHARKIYVSHHSNKVTEYYPPHITLKVDVKELKAKTVVFIDDTEEEIDDIIYCTGYDYDFPFLDETCGLELTQYSIKPLYRDIVNINHPTMFFMNMVTLVSPFISADMQSRFCAKIISGAFELPTKEIMMQSFQDDVTEKKQLGISNKRYHTMGHRERAYFNGLADESGADRARQIAIAIHVESTETRRKQLQISRNFTYKILNECTFTKGLENQEPKVITLNDCVL